MNEIKRFNHQVCEYPGGTFSEMNQEADGDYVLYSDHEAEVVRLRAEVEGLRAELAETNDRFDKYRHSASKDYAALFARKDACANDVAIYKDAQRYRWLRAGSGTTWDQPWVAVGHCDIEWVKQPNEIEGKQLDSAIDAAMGASA